MELKVFGLEIRKIGNLDNLYHDVDRVLNNNNITAGSSGVSANVQIYTIAHVLQKMLEPTATFYCTTIDDCSKISGIVVSEERRKIYHAIHCMKWSEMQRDYRQSIMAMILDDFREILNPKQ